MLEEDLDYKDYSSMDYLEGVDEEFIKKERTRIKKLQDKLLADKKRFQDETDKSIIQELIVSFNNNREAILSSDDLKEKYFTEEEHLELVGAIDARLSQLIEVDLEGYEYLVQIVSEIYKAEIDKYYAFSYDKDDVPKELDIDSIREHLKPYEDFLRAYERNLFELSDDEKDNIYGTMRNISETPYYNMNKYHSISHIQKVIMFSGILAKNEKLSSEETKILLAAAAFHDSGRNGREEEYDNHATESARQVAEYFENNPDNPFGITSENISMIQAVIEYHEYKEQEKGVTDIAKLEELSHKYNIDQKKFKSLVKISELLKDADALDRARFGRRNENRDSLDAKYLRSDTAKSISMIRFSEECNFRFAEREAQGSEETPVTLSQRDIERLFEHELFEASINKIRMPSVKQVTHKIPPHKKKSMMDVLKNIQRGIEEFLDEIDKG